MCFTTTMNGWSISMAVTAVIHEQQQQRIFIYFPWNWFIRELLLCTTVNSTWTSYYTFLFSIHFFFCRSHVRAPLWPFHSLLPGFIERAGRPHWLIGGEHNMLAISPLLLCQSHYLHCPTKLQYLFVIFSRSVRLWLRAPLIFYLQHFLQGAG